MRRLPEPDTAIRRREDRSIAHESAAKHITGRAQYLDDIPEWPDMLHVATAGAEYAHAIIEGVDLEAARSAPGVVDLIIQRDIPGNPDISPVFSGDLLLAGEKVDYLGQPVVAVAATSLTAAKRACALVKIRYRPLEPRLSVKEALAREDFVLPSHTLAMGDAAAAIAAAEHPLAGELYLRGQEHFYLEGQISIALPSEDGGARVYSSSQHPAEVQKLVAQVLGQPLHLVQAEVRRMGGAFGGKESQAASLACMAAVFAVRNRRPVKYRMPRRDDMVQTGKRHDFWNSYRVGFDSKGLIQGVEMDLVGLCGHSADLSDGVVDRAMFHADNAYYLPSARISGHRCRTNTVSNTAFRGFGGPQGMLAAEAMLDDIAHALGADPLDIRKRNLYRDGRNTTPYGQKVEEQLLPELIEQLERTSDYRNRRREIRDFNAASKYRKKGLSLTPVKFGISFTSKHLNQAGALVHIYADGSIHVSHGGTEMGQGLHTKIAQIVARGFGVDLDRVQVAATATDQVPNASPTAASAGTDLNGMAALNAVNTLKQRLLEYAAETYDTDIDRIAIRDDHCWVDGRAIPFAELVKGAYMARVSLSATGFYRTPKIGYDRAAARGRPFHYFANGAAVSEVSVDLHTGEYRVTRVDILHDVGDSLNPAIDLGQIEGGFVQGMGWLTSEELLWDGRGRIISDSPANYKIPTAGDLPEIFNIDFFQHPLFQGAAGAEEETVYRSKAVGEPPLMLAISVWCALRDACASLADYRFSPPLGVPATPEQVYFCARAALQFAEEAKR
ncbi:xanthine dehydrogenase molybdopterin binding subunit [Microbulbifer rhizosphaerae]|uniref:Xanthine dehydrogenase large subunit n=1 Tax=Microbulbifer rhizosphaerae TaxID=1562603 RepID=A0A7W4WFK5_9GAMM|nr:xanthine dehydrogenase molybdopterin binding subunit [Microbulbifer rhizosphaerae]MBB3062872.1 xanthine dehydrogenase large subunit [Microbulbifer rhizosphaerae]